MQFSSAAKITDFDLVVAHKQQVSCAQVPVNEPVRVVPSPFTIVHGACAH